MDTENLSKGDVDKKKDKEEINQTGGQEVEDIIREKKDTIPETENAGIDDSKKKEERDKHQDEFEEAEHEEHHKGKKKHKKGSDKEAEALKQEIGELKDKYLRLYSEFENFRRRTSREKLDLINTASEELITALLPVIDDFERAIRAMSEKEMEDNKTSLEGVQLIFNKLKYTVEQRGLKAMNTDKGDEFNAEIHEAITKIPVEDEDLKGKVVEVLEKGYYLHDKVIRFAKVITGS